MGLVLIAEDEAAMLEICADIVEELGHRTLRAHDGEEALLLARTERPDLVISDHMMPRRTGVQLLRALRSDPGLAAIPFLLLSAARPKGLEEASAFLPKPVDVSTFEAAVEKMLGPAPEAAQQEDRRRTDQRRGNDAVREEMLNWLAHEIKTPLGAARMSAQLLERRLGEAQTSHSEKKLFATIMHQLDRIQTLVTSILDAARLSEAKMELQLVRADLSAFLREVVSDWCELQPQATFTLAGTEDRLDLSFDGERLRQVLNNLLANAVKYGGPASRVQVTLSSSPSHALVEVQDWGEGIAASKLPTIFERFHRADTTNGRGHGLGLFIAAALARLHGGTLAARSELGKGSTFTLRLPLAR
ncbi:MAG TPA: ATP-binding protein [Myxococcales bacterium]|nr:ATP-binding protein [Myxococcales bacterium]